MSTAAVATASRTMPARWPLSMVTAARSAVVAVTVVTGGPTRVQDSGLMGVDRVWILMSGRRDCLRPSTMSSCTSAPRSPRPCKSAAQRYDTTASIYGCASRSAAGPLRLESEPGGPQIVPRIVRAAKDLVDTMSETGQDTAISPPSHRRGPHAELSCLPSGDQNPLLTSSSATSISPGIRSSRHLLQIFTHVDEQRSRSRWRSIAESHWHH